MSWKDNYVQDLIIVTGDGESFTVFTLPSFAKEVEFNVTEYNFVDVDDPLIKKTTVAKNEIPLEFFFINDDHLTEAASFLFSAEDPQPWTITHPYYGTVLCQVDRIKQDDTDGNITKFTCIAKKTIEDGTTVKVSINQADFIQLKAIQVTQLPGTDPGDLRPTIPEKNVLLATTAKNYKTGVKIIQNPIDAQTYFNAFNTANSYINTITATPILAAQALINVIMAPANFEATVQDRIRIFMNQMANLRNTIIGLTSTTAKQLFTIQGLTLMSGMCVTSVTPSQGDYSNASVALTIIDQIKAAYRTFLSDLDSIEGANGGNPLFFIPDYNWMTALNSLITTTTSQLFDIALAGRKEFIYVLPDDSNVITLTNKFYGLDLQDNNIQQFITNNNITYSEVALGLKKGRTVVYYA